MSGLNTIVPLDDLPTDRLATALYLRRLLRRRPLGWVVRDSVLGQAAAGLITITPAHNGIDQVYRINVPQRVGGH